MPTYYISHGGGPWSYLEGHFANAHQKLADFLRTFPNTLLQKPRGILIISAHWEEPEFTVMNGESPGMIYDYGGFPESTYTVSYPAPGSPEIAAEVTTLIHRAGIPVTTHPTRGFDHGTFVPLSVSYPNADVPVIQLSMRHDYDPNSHFRLGQALSPLRNSGILILGSGSSFHNLSMFGPQAKTPAREFDSWLHETMALPPDQRQTQLSRWESAPSARMAHPREDHLVPLFVVAGAAGNDPATCPLNDTEFFGGIHLSTFKFG